MAGINLAAIGAGLGIAAQDYLKKRQADQQMLAQQAAMQQIQQKQQAESLLGSLPGSTFAGGGGAQGLAGLFAGGGTDASQAASSAPAPSYAPAGPSGGGLNLPGARSFPGSAAGGEMPARIGTSGYGPNAQMIDLDTGQPWPSPNRPMAMSGPISVGPQSAPPRMDGPMSLPGGGASAPIPSPPRPSGPMSVAPQAYGAMSPGRQVAADVSQAAAGGEGQQPAPAEPVPQMSGQPAAPTEMSGQPGGAPTHQAAPISNPAIQRLLGPSLNLGSVMDKIRAARPDADPGTVWRATQMVYTMLERGNAAEMNNAIRVLTQLRLGEQFQTSSSQRGQQIAETARAHDLTDASRKVTAGQRGEQLDISRGRAATTKEQGAERLGIARQRLQQTADAAKAAMANRDVNSRRAALSQVLRDVQKQLYPGFGNAPPDEALLPELKRQETELTNELRKMGGMPTLGAPAAPAQP